MITFTNFTKHYGSTLALTVPDMQLPPGVYWLRGENGSGKSTLIRSIAGLIPFQGSVAVQGIDVRHQGVQFRRIVNYAEAEPLYPAILTGSDLIRFYAATKGATSQQITQTISLFGIGGFVDNKIGTYSSGMTKKLSLVLSLLGSPRLILLDEPLITLDVASVDLLRTIILSQYRQGISFIITSHQELDFDGFKSSRLLIAHKTLTRL
jgi:ABC-2 type transport system ATP-binding protein